MAGITAATFSTAAAFIADITPPEKRGARFGLIGACFGVGFVARPADRRASGRHRHPRAVLRRRGHWPPANLAFGYFVLPETVTDATRRPFAWPAPTRWARCGGHRLPGVRLILASS